MVAMLLVPLNDHLGIVITVTPERMGMQITLPPTGLSVDWSRRAEQPKNERQQDTLGQSHLVALRHLFATRTIAATEHPAIGNHVSRHSTGDPFGMSIGESPVPAAGTVIVGR